jgi:hypothetical protein
MIEISSQWKFKDYFALVKYVEKLDDRQKNDFICFVFQENRVSNIPRMHLLDFYLLFDTKMLKAALNEQFCLRKLLRRLPQEQRILFLFGLIETRSFADLITDEISLLRCLEAFEKNDRDRVLNLIDSDTFYQIINSLEHLVMVSRLLSEANQCVFWMEHKTKLESYLDTAEDLVVLVNAINQSSIRYFVLKMLSAYIKKMDIPLETSLYLLQLLDKENRLAALKVIGHSIKTVDQLQQYTTLSLFNPGEASILLRAPSEPCKESKSKREKTGLFKAAVIVSEPKQDHYTKQTQLKRPT